LGVITNLSPLDASVPCSAHLIYKEACVPLASLYKTSEIEYLWYLPGIKVPELSAAAPITEYIGVDPLYWLSSLPVIFLVVIGVVVFGSRKEADGM